MGRGRGTAGALLRSRRKTTDARRSRPLLSASGVGPAAERESTSRTWIATWQPVMAILSTWESKTID